MAFKMHDRVRHIEDKCGRNPGAVTDVGVWGNEWAVKWDSKPGVKKWYVENDLVLLDVAKAPDAPRFEVGDEVTAPGYKRVIGIHTVTRVHTDWPYMTETGYELSGTGGLFVASELRPAKPYAYHFAVSDASKIDWQRICWETPDGVDVVKVTRPDRNTVFLLRESWLRKAPADSVLGLASIAFILHNDTFVKWDGVCCPVGWRCCIVGDLTASMVLEDIARIRAAIAAPKPPQIVVKVEKV